MPLYDRKCVECDELFEVVCKISEKDNKQECPHCGATEGEWMISAPNFSTGQRMGTSNDKKTGFHEVISKIAKTYPRSELAKRV